MLRHLYICLNYPTYKSHLLCPILCYFILSTASFPCCIFRNFSRKAPLLEICILREICFFSFFCTSFTWNFHISWRIRRDVII